LGKRSSMDEQDQVTVVLPFKEFGDIIQWTQLNSVQLLDYLLLCSAPGGPYSLTSLPAEA
jgi:hypothetical protein